MYKTKSIGVIIRAYNEQKFISGVIKRVPGYVDSIYVVNDASTDNTGDIVRKMAAQDSRIVPVNRSRRGGAGAAAITGYKKAIEGNNHIVAILDGDGQMDSRLLCNFLDILISGRADYVKGNRLSNRKDKTEMPAWRAFGNFLLTHLTRVASGYWHISDPQNGYTAISVQMLRQLDLEGINKGFAYENDMLINLNVAGAKVVDIPHPAIYRGQKSKINYRTFILGTSWTLLKGLIWRLSTKLSRKSKSAVLSPERI